MDEHLGLAEIISEALKSTILADSNAAEQAYNLIQRYAYGEENADNTKLETVSFTMTASDGTTHEVSMPKLLLMPLPLLHVTEASFEINADMSINTDESLKDNNSTTGSKPLPSGKKLNPTAALSEVKKIANPQVRKLVGQRIMLNVNSVKQNTETETETKKQAKSNTNLKVNIKMEQSDMPAGITSLLQIIANNSITDKNV